MASERTIEPEFIEPDPFEADRGSGAAREKLARDRASVARRFWPKLKSLALKLPFLEDLLAAYYCAFDRDTPRHVQMALFGALAYFVMPFDAMPDLLPLIGFGDDAAVLAAALRLVSTHIKPVHYDAARGAIARGLEKAEAEATAAD